MNISRMNLGTLIENTAGQAVIFEFTKKDGTPRRLQGIFQKRESYNNAIQANLPYRQVFDLEAMDYRNVNLKTISKVVVGMVCYSCTDEA